MKEDYLYEWWMKNRFDEFCTCLHAWSNSMVNPEDHSRLEVRTDRAITYFDSINKGFIGQYLLTKYAMDFIEEVVECYWQIEESQS